MSERVNANEELQKFIFTSKYARWIPELKRRETWDEAVDRVRDMHLRKFTSILPEEDLNDIRWAFELVRQKRVLPSMRSMQFGGKAVEACNARLYNCCVRHIDSIRSFAEMGFLMLTGTGTGIGLSKKYLSRLPNYVGAEDKTGTVINYTIEDNIEGWADSLEALLSCYFKNTALSGRKIVFDFSKIRKKGSLLKTSGGKAPGYKPLKTALGKIKDLLDYAIEEKGHTRLSSIDAYDILMLFADCVVSGGIRRTASIVIFDQDDQDMIDAKVVLKVKKFRESFDEEHNTYHSRIWVKDKFYDVVFDCNDAMDKFAHDQLVKDKAIYWKYIYPHRGRSNNSVRILRDKIDLETFSEIFERTKQYGEPGFFFCNNEDTLINPCQPANAIVLTPDGIKKFGDLVIGDKIWSESGWTTVINKWSNGYKKVYNYRTTAGSFLGTENHKVLSHTKKVEVKDASDLDLLVGPDVHCELDPQDVMDGLVFGDGSVHIASNNLVHLFIGDNDQDYFNSEISHLITKHRPGIAEKAYEITTTICPEDLGRTFDRSIPDKFFFGSPKKVLGFLRGLYTANGSVVANRITLKTSSQKVRDQIQSLLSSVGIKSYYTTNLSTKVQFNNGTYLCKESYDVNISVDRHKFAQSIGFIQKYKGDKLESILKISGNGQTNYDIKATEYIGEEEVFDITVDNPTHTYWTNGINVSNCAEVGFIPVALDGTCGVQFCNLVTSSGSRIKTKEDFQECVKAQTIIGTLQASYTDFPYLSPTAKQLTEEEALLGDSITGFMANPELLLNADVLKEMSLYAVSVNEEWAKKLGINPAARICLVKPEGTASLVSGDAPGIHPFHAQKFFRRVQANTEDNVYRFFKEHNSHATEVSVWNNHGTDDVITFPIEIQDKVIVKEDLSAIQHLEYAKIVQHNWVLPSQKNNKKDVNHNVSITVIVKDHEWGEVIKYVYDNREDFTAVSFIGYSGDKDYQQAPNEKVTTVEDHDKFDLLADYMVAVDYTQLKENSDGTYHVAEAACAGGACLI